MTVATAAACGTMAARIFYCDLLDCRVGILRSISTLQPPRLTAVGVFHDRDGDLLVYFVSLIFFRRDTCRKIFARIGIILLCEYTDNATGSNNICRYIMASHRIEYRSAEVRCSYLVYYYVPWRSSRCRCCIPFDKYLQLRLSVKILNVF